MLNKSIKFLRLVAAAAFLAVGATAHAQVNVQKVSGGANSITQDLAIGVGRTLTIAGTITGSGPIGTTGTLSSGTFSTGALSITGSMTVSGSFTASGASTLATATITTATISTLTAAAENATTSSISTLTVSGTLRATSPTAGIGYGTGSGGTVTQTTSKSNAVTLNAVSGQITLNTFSLSAATNVSFTLSNSAISTNDLIITNIDSGGTLGAYQVWVSAVGTGSASLTVRNVSASTLTESPVIIFALIKGSNN
jgi:hypothetical protein